MVRSLGIKPCSRTAQHVMGIYTPSICRRSSSDVSVLYDDSVPQIRWALGRCDRFSAARGLLFKPVPVIPQVILLRYGHLAGLPALFPPDASATLFTCGLSCPTAHRSVYSS